MSEAFFLRPRSPRARRRLALAPAGPALAFGDRPRLTMAEPEDLRSTWITGALSLALHAAFLLVLFWIALQASEEIAQELIPVRILQARPIELPGSNEPVAPAPRQLTPRRLVSAASLAPAAALDAVAPQAVEAARIDSRALDLDAIRQAPVPTELQRREVSAARLEALQPSAVPRAATLEHAPAPAIDLDASMLQAPRVDLSAPRALAAPRAPVVAPESFAGFEAVAGREYRDTVGAAPQAVGLSERGDYGAVKIDTSAPEVAPISGGSDAPLLPGSLRAVPCDESAFVQRYIEEVERRTRQQWQVPDGTKRGDVAKLDVDIDRNGTARNIRVESASSPELGDSAASALRMASPFAPLDENTRCMADIQWGFTLTYGGR